MKKTILFALVLLCLLGLAKAENLKISLAKPLQPYAQNRLLVDSPIEGLLTLTIKSRAVDWVIARDVPVIAGQNELVYDGLHINGEPLHGGRFTLSATLATAGEEQSFETDLQVSRPLAVLQYALPRGELLYLRGGKFEVDVYKTRSVATEITLFKRGEAPQTGVPVRFIQDKNQTLLFSWDGKVNGKPIAPGDYVLRFAVNKGEGGQVDIPLTALDEAPPHYPVQVTPKGDFLPETLDDATVWQAMMAPITVVESDQVYRQNIYTKPDTKSPVSGQVSSQTAGLKVLRLEGDFAYIGAYNHKDGAYFEGYVKLDRLKTYKPNTRWGLLLNKAAQTMTVYRDGKPIGSTKISTGLMLRYATRQETRAGAFLVGQRLPYFDNLGYRYRYAMRVDGFNLVHQLGHPISGTMNFDVEDAVMGQKASHGCIRIDRFPGEGGINAFWLWTNIPSHTKMLVLDDKDVRHAQLAKFGLPITD
ncbi:MAG: L,D-transpeptidase [Clostridiales bacterium]|nr:L,D-transpeptidase [Clostridiales bacterium]